MMTVGEEEDDVFMVNDDDYFPTYDTSFLCPMSVRVDMSGFRFFVCLSYSAGLST